MVASHLYLGSAIHTVEKLEAGKPLWRDLTRRCCGVIESTLPPRKFFPLLWQKWSWLAAIYFHLTTEDG